MIPSIPPVQSIVNNPTCPHRNIKAVDKLKKGRVMYYCSDCGRYIAKTPK